MRKTKTINNYETFVKELNLEKKQNEKKYFDLFFKRRFIIIENNGIKHPTTKDLTKRIQELEDQKAKQITLKNFWKKEYNSAKNYKQKIKFTKYTKRMFWKHKIKQVTNKEYNEDLKNARLTDNTLLDPRHEKLFNTFLTDYDYRKKLIDTVNKSLIYRDSDIGEHSKKRQELKTTTAKNMTKSLIKKIEETNKEIKANKIVLKYLKKI